MPTRRAVLSPGAKPPYAAESFDVVVCGFGIIHVPDPARGKSDRPVAIDQYTIFHLVGDLVGVLDALDAKKRGRRRPRRGRERGVAGRTNAPRSRPRRRWAQCPVPAAREGAADA